LRFSFSRTRRARADDFIDSLLPARSSIISIYDAGFTVPMLGYERARDENDSAAVSAVVSDPSVFFTLLPYQSFDERPRGCMRGQGSAVLRASNNCLFVEDARCKTLSRSIDVSYSRSDRFQLMRRGRLAFSRFGVNSARERGLKWIRGGSADKNVAFISPATELCDKPESGM